jgi:ribonuclease HI
LELVSCMGVKHVKAFGDSQLVVQHVLGEYQCWLPSKMLGHNSFL